MATKELGKRTGARQKKRQTAPLKRQGGRVKLGRSRLVRDLLPPFFISAALSRAVILGECVPFSLGYVAAAGPGPQGAAALGGALLGYVAFLPVPQALRCCAAAILLYTVELSCFDLRVYRQKWFMATVSMIITALTLFVYQSGAGWTPERLVRFASETALVGSSCVWFTSLTPPRGEKPSREALVYLSLLVSLVLSGVHPLLGGTAAALTALLAGRGGVGAGAAAGGLCGLAAGLGRGGTPLMGAVLSAAGAAAGSRSGRHRLEAVLAFALAGILSAMWAHAGTMAALECTAAAVVYSALPDKLLQALDGLLASGSSCAPAPVHRFSALERSQYRLEEQAGAYRTLCQHIAQGLDAQAPEESAVIFERTMERVCTGCFLYSVCWQRDYSTTCEELTGVLEAMLERGSAEREDFPDPFRRRCGRMEAFLRTTNEELYGYWTRRRSHERLRDSRRAVCAQYEQLARLLSAAADHLGEEVEEDAAGAAACERTLRSQGMDVRCRLQVDQRGRRTLEVRGRGLEALNGEEGVRLLSGALGVRMEPTASFRVRQGEQLVFQQCPPLSATVAVASRRKQEGQTNGDNGLWFRDQEGILWVALCDGMGSGNAAARDSRLLTTLLKDFLQAGVDPAAALSTLSGALSLAGELDGGFTTVDLLRLDLFSGSAALFKLGGAPTYLRRGGLVSRITGSALPAGLGGEENHRPDESRFRLAAEDYVLLITDGITDAQADQWLRTALSRYEGESPRELAQAVLSSPAAGREDDRTVVAVRLTVRV